MSLHNLRHQNKVELRIFIGEGMGYHLLPRLLLQPLVENSIIHGLGNRLEGGHITIHAEEKDGFLNIRVEDDGVGFPEGFDLDMRQKDKKRNKASFSSIGLVNVRDRVNLYYEGNSHFRLYNRMEDGVCRGAVVEISIRLEAIERYERE